MSLAQGKRGGEGRRWPFDQVEIDGHGLSPSSGQRGPRGNPSLGRGGCRAHLEEQGDAGEAMVRRGPLRQVRGWAGRVDLTWEGTVSFCAGGLASVLRR